MAVAQPSVRLGAVEAALGSSNIADKIKGPAQKLLQNDASKHHNGRVFRHLNDVIEGFGRNPKGRSVFLFLGWHIVVVFGEVVCINVVTAVRRLPRKVGCQERGMADEPHCIVKNRRWRKDAMTTLVAQNLSFVRMIRPLSSGDYLPIFQ